MNRYDFAYGIGGQMINVPVDVLEMVKCLPRRLDEDQAINIDIESVYLSGHVNKRTIGKWLDVLQRSTLYRMYDIKLDWDCLNAMDVPAAAAGSAQDSTHIKDMCPNTMPECEVLATRQHKMI
jgi:hypothetical protein